MRNTYHPRLHLAPPLHHRTLLSIDPSSPHDLQGLRMLPHKLIQARVNLAPLPDLDNELLAFLRGQISQETDLIRGVQRRCAFDQKHLFRSFAIWSRTPCHLVSRLFELHRSSHLTSSRTVPDYHSPPVEPSSECRIDRPSRVYSIWYARLQGPIGLQPQLIRGLESAGPTLDFKQSSLNCIKDRA